MAIVDDTTIELHPKVVGEWKVSIQDAPWSLLKEIVIWRECGTDSIEVILFETPMVKRMGPNEPLDRASVALFPEILPALAAALDAKGIKPPSRSFAEGELTATKAHLADLRKLVFRKGA